MFVSKPYEQTQRKKFLARLPGRYLHLGWCYPAVRAPPTFRNDGDGAERPHVSAARPEFVRRMRAASVISDMHRHHETAGRRDSRSPEHERAPASTFRNDGDGRGLPPV
jgi:hypothetical protein